jgi:hypothetical protein
MFTLHSYQLPPCNQKIRCMLDLKSVACGENYRELIQQMAATTSTSAAP